MGNRRKNRQLRKLFSTLYNLFFELQREAETEEIIVANGLLFDRDNSSVRHPVLTHRVKLNYNPDTNVVTIEDGDVQSELYSISRLSGTCKKTARKAGRQGSGIAQK